MFANFIFVCGRREVASAQTLRWTQHEQLLQVKQSQNTSDPHDGGGLVMRECPPLCIINGQGMAGFSQLRTWYSKDEEAMSQMLLN